MPISPYTQSPCFPLIYPYFYSSTPFCYPHYSQLHPYTHFPQAFIVDYLILSAMWLSPPFLLPYPQIFQVSQYGYPHQHAGEDFSTSSVIKQAGEECNNDCIPSCIPASAITFVYLVAKHTF